MGCVLLQTLTRPAVGHWQIFALKFFMFSTLFLSLCRSVDLIQWLLKSFSPCYVPPSILFMVIEILWVLTQNYCNFTLFALLNRDDACFVNLTENWRSSLRCMVRPPSLVLKSQSRWNSVSGKSFGPIFFAVRMFTFVCCILCWQMLMIIYVCHWWWENYEISLFVFN